MVFEVTSHLICVILTLQMLFRKLASLTADESDDTTSTHFEGTVKGEPQPTYDCPSSMPNHADAVEVGIDEILLLKDWTKKKLQRLLDANEKYSSLNIC